MNFRTELHFEKLLDLSNDSKVYSIGSCFANMIGSKLENYKVDCMSNPFGIVYNPISIFKLLSNDINLESSMVENDGIWYNHNFHSELRNLNKKVLQEDLINIQKNSKKELQKTDLLIITLGTAFVYEQIENRVLVANCHKISQKKFNKKLLSVEKIVSNFEQLYNQLISATPTLKIIFTVSPVRHIKDTIELNSVSKSILRLACYQLQNKFSNVHYFPSFELMMDDLRDYRYYKDDLLHPTPFAENYIWDKFKNSIFHNSTLSIFEEWDKIKSSLDHKSFNPESEKHQDFLKKLLVKLKGIETKINCNEEIKTVKGQLI